MLSDEELDQLELSRHKDSDWVLEHLGLMAVLQKYGEARIVGAKALGLMIAKDIDMSVLVEKVSVPQWQRLVSELMRRQHVRNISAIDYYTYDEQNRYDPVHGQKYSLYVSINNIMGPEQSKYDTWDCQIHLIEHKTFDEQKVSGIQNKISPENRITILGLKYWAHKVNGILRTMTNGNFKIASPLIYQAVLDDNVDTINGLMQHIQSSVPHQFRDAFDFALTQVNS